MKIYKKILTLLCFICVGLLLTSCNILNSILPTYSYDLFPTTSSSITTTTHSHNDKTTNETEEGFVENIIYDDLQIHFLELGNEYAGDSVYIKAGNNDILIDAGSRKGSAETIKEYVDKYCTDKKLEYVIATHAHQDHIAGFVGNSKNNSRTGILYQYKVGTIIDFALTGATSQIYEDYLYAVEYAIENGASQYNAADCFNNENGASRTYSLGEGISLEILYNYYYFNTTEDENDYSVCVMLKYNDLNFMFTGDLEEEGEHKMAEYYDGSTPEKTLPHVEVFKAGHHGSKTSSNDCLLSKITPSIVCVCACAGSTEYTANYNNIFPTQEFITRIAKYTDRVYCTSLFDEKEKTFKSMNGNIIVSSNGLNIGLDSTNNLIKLKDSEWFNQTVYVDNNDNIVSKKGKEDFFTAETPGVTAVVRRVWPK